LLKAAATTSVSFSWLTKRIFFLADEEDLRGWNELRYSVGGRINAPFVLRALNPSKRVRLLSQIPESNSFSDVREKPVRNFLLPDTNKMA